MLWTLALRIDPISLLLGVALSLTVTGVVWGFILLYRALCYCCRRRDGAGITVSEQYAVVPREEEGLEMNPFGDKE